MQQHSPLDRLIINFDHGLRTVLGRPLTTERPNPAKDYPEPELNEKETRLVVGLMRINHAGEVSAQALYQGQSLTAHTEKIRETMKKSAIEENDHLVWCEQRVEELGGHVSYLNPFWYQGSFIIGAMAGMVGDKYSLGFVAETEKQVIKHLDDHLQKLPVQDEKSRMILEQMREDEAHHATVALDHGAIDLPKPVQLLMTAMSKVMTKTAFWV